MNITWLGHASFKIKTKENKVIYIDPYFGEYDEKADLILVSHGHSDHFNMEKIQESSVDSTVVMSVRDVALRIVGAIEIAENQEKTIGDIKVKTTPMYSRTHPKGSGVGFLIEADKMKIYFAGDCDLIPEITKVKADIVLLPVGGTYTMDAKQAAQACLQINPKLAIPMHYGSGIVGTYTGYECVLFLPVPFVAT